MGLRRLVVLSVQIAVAAAPQAKTASESPADPGWPRVYSDGKATIAVHQPQVDDWKDFKLLEARTAVEIVASKGGKKQIAAVHWQARTGTNMESRTVSVAPIEITRFYIPGLDEEQTGQMRRLTLSLLPKQKDTLTLDRVLPYLDTTRVVARQVEISREAPPILVSTKPALLVMIDGQPILGPVEGTKLSYIVNTNWDLFKDEDGDFYLLNETQWLTAESLEGTWKAATKLPKDFKSFPAGPNWDDVRLQLPVRDDNKKRPAP